jgi:ABC-type branched-subunit amino acid transport system substrate-binding protein
LYPGAGGIPLVQQLQSSPLYSDNLIIGDYTYNTPPLLQSMGPNLEGLIYSAADESATAVQEVAEKIESEHDHPVATYNILGYDLADLMATAVTETDQVTAVSVRDTLRNTTFDNISGWQSDFDENGNNVATRLILNEYVDDGGTLDQEMVFRSGPLERVSL